MDIQNELDKRFMELEGVDCEVDSILELMGFSLDFRKCVPSLVDDLKEVILIEILRVFKEELKKKVGGKK